MNDQAETEVPEKSSGEGQRVLLLVALALLLIDLYLLVGVVPKFKAMFDALRGELPRLTQLVLALSNVLTMHLVIVVLLVGIGVWAGVRWAARVPLVIPVVMIVVLSGLVVLTPLAIFYPILQLQSAIREGDAQGAPPERPGEISAWNSGEGVPVRHRWTVSARGYSAMLPTCVATVSVTSSSVPG